MVINKVKLSCNTYDEALFWHFFWILRPILLYLRGQTYLDKVLNYEKKYSRIITYIVC